MRSIYICISLYLFFIFVLSLGRVLVIGRWRDARWCNGGWSRFYAWWSGAEVRQALIWWCTAGGSCFGSAHQAFPKSPELYAVSHHRSLTLFAASRLDVLGYFGALLGYFWDPLGYFFAHGLTLFVPALLLFWSGLTLLDATYENFDICHSL